jgi:hypothetical protein
MGARFSRKRAFFLSLAAFGFVLLLSAGRAQDRPAKTAPPGRAGAAQVQQAERTGVAATEEGSLRRLAAALRHYRAAGDLAAAARTFAEMFTPDPQAGASALEAGASLASNRIEGAPGNIKTLDVPSGTSPVFFSPEVERSPAALLVRSGQEAWIFAAAEQWSGGAPRDLRIRKSTDKGLTWDETVVLGDGQAWTGPSIGQVADGAIGLAFVRDGIGAGADIFFSRLAGDLSADAKFPVAAGPADERNPSLATDFPRFSPAYLYVLYAERDPLGRSVKFRISPDLGASWSEPVTVASFPGPGGPEIETTLAYDPDRNVLHAAFSGPNGGTTGVAVSSSTTFGASWSVPVFVASENGAAAARPRIAAGRGQAVLVYERRAASGGADIGLAASSNGGRSWTTGAALAGTSADETFPDVRADAGTGPFRFVASFVESGKKIRVLSREASAASAWTAELAVDAGGAVATGPVAVVPVPSSGGRALAGVLWTSGGPDTDVLYGSDFTLLLADLAVTPANQNVPAAAGTTDFAVTRSGNDEDIAWTAAVTSGAAWLSITSGSSGTNDGTIVAAYDENTGTSPRVGTIVVTPAGGAGPLTVTVTQAGAAGLEITPADDFLSSGPVGGPFVPASKDYTLRNTTGAVLAWTAADNRTWINLSRTSGNLDPGASDVITVFFTSGADVLGTGVHTGTVTFTNRTTGVGNGTRGVSLTISGTPGTLAVTPAEGLTSTGGVGGPFTPSSIDYTLRNSGTTSIDWQASKTQDWTSLSSVSGTLDAGASTTVTVSINAAANGLAIGIHQDTAAFTNLTNGNGSTTRTVTLTVTAPPGVLTVTPAGGLTSTGPEGGPFTPVSQTYTLQNTGESSLAWTASKTQSWTTLSATGGTLAVGDSATVMVSINSAANALAAGDYTDTVSFVNTTTGNGSTTRPVILTVLHGPALSVTPANRDVTFTGGTVTFDVANLGAGTMNWTAAVVSGSDWLTISSGGSGTNAGTVTVVAAANRTPSERVGIVRVTAAGATGSPANVTVSQIKGSLVIALSGERLVEKAWTIEREFARLTVAIDNPASVPIETFVVYRRSGGGGEQVVKQVDGSAATGPTLRIDDAFLEHGVTYTYRVAAVDVFGGTLAVSNEITIQ